MNEHVVEIETMPQQLLTEKYLEAARDANQECASIDYSENSLDHGGAPKVGWTKGLTIICIFFFLISFFGSLSAGFGLYGLFGPQEKVAKVKSDVRKPKEVVEFEKNFAQVQEKFFPILTYLEIMKLVLAMCFLIAVLMMVFRSTKARSFAIGICAMALIFHLCNMGVNFWMLGESGGTLGQLFTAGLDDIKEQAGLTQEEHEQAKEFVVNSVGMGMTIGLGVVILVRVLFYGFVIAYLCQSEIKPIFGEDGLKYLKEATDDALVPA